MTWKSTRSETTQQRDPMQEFANHIIAELEKGL
jgi:hypothetical protein